MIRKNWVLLFVVLVVTAMLLSSCGTPTATNSTGVTVTGATKATTAAAITTTTTTTTTTSSAAATTTAGAETMVDTLGKTIIKPQYGGTYTMASLTDLLGFDNVYTYNYNVTSASRTNEPLVAGDWAKGPSGTNEVSWQMTGITFLQYSTGIIAESWEIPDGQTIIYHIRHGIHFQNKPPVNGRELTANDVLWNFKRAFETPAAYCYVTYRGADAPTLITAPDEWTIKITCNPGKQGPLFIVTAGFINIFPPDGVGADGTYKDWKTLNGTGPFILTDYVPQSSNTIVKNPNYWRNDPLTGMRLPYVDKNITLVIPDMATIVAGLQTGKIDHYLGVPWDQAIGLKKAYPDLLNGYYIGTAGLIHMLFGKGFPWDNIQIRKAMHIAVDRKKIVTDYYGGNATEYCFPWAFAPELSDIFTPLSELPQSIQDLYTYDLAGAKKLMADAGQAAGFKAEIIASSASQQNLDLLALVAGMWKNINIDLTIKPLDNAVYTAQANAKSYSNLIFTGGGGAGGAPYKVLLWRPGIPQNYGNIDSPEMVDVYNRVNEVYPFDTPAANAILKAATPLILENCWTIPLPGPHVYWFAQPWVHNYSGEVSVGYYQATGAVTYHWLDQKLKAKLR